MISAKILISNEDHSQFLTGNLSRNEYSFNHNKELAFCFDTEREAIQFEETEPIRSFLEDMLTDLVTYNNPDKSIYSA